MKGSDGAGANRQEAKNGGRTLVLSGNHQLATKTLPEKVRRSGRFLKEIAILLIGSDMEGKVFSEQTKTVVLSRHGAGIVSQHKLSPEQELIIRCPDANKEAEARVVGQIGSQSGSYTYGIAFLDADINLWGVEFPPLTLSERQAGLWSLECNACKSRETLDDSDLESDVCATNEGVVRYCKRCGYSTVWKRALGVANHPSVSTESVQEPAVSVSLMPAPMRATAVLMIPPPPKPAAPPINRRKHVRLKVKLSACIRHPGVEDEEIVACEDMSRGGLCFKSRKRYFESSIIEVAVPYSPGDLAIFVSAQIVHVEELAGQNVFRCGVAYLKSTTIHHRS
jgi:hypothetical protein